MKWNLQGEHLGKVCDLDAFVTDMSWFPSAGQQTSDMFAISCSDGTIRLLSKSGNEQKKIKEAAGGAVICLKWSFDGNSLASGGEDGSVKIWSRSGMLRNNFSQQGAAVYTLAWGQIATNYFSVVVLIVLLNLLMLIVNKYNGRRMMA